MVQALARLKTNEILRRLAVQADENDDELIVIGADTMVFYQEHALGKPKDEADAARMLGLLSDEVHEVKTGVSIVIREKDGKQEDISFAVCTKVVVHALTSEQIMDYIATKEPMDKAGAYAIQGKFGIYIKGIIGDYYNIVGFPIAEIYDTLLSRGIDLKKLK
jgi:septum formation protein